jgi:hypothetical protein
MTNTEVKPKGQSSGELWWSGRTPQSRNIVLSWLDDGKADIFQPHLTSIWVGTCRVGKLYLSGALHCGEMKIETPVVALLTKSSPRPGFYYINPQLYIQD